MVHDYYVNRYTDLGNTLVQLRPHDPLPGQLGGADRHRRCRARWHVGAAPWPTGRRTCRTLRDFIETRCVHDPRRHGGLLRSDGALRCGLQRGPAAERARSRSTPSRRTPTRSTATTTAASTPPWRPCRSRAGSSATGRSSAPTPSCRRTTDSLVTIDILTADSIVAHFVPPTRYDIVLGCGATRCRRASPSMASPTPSFPVMVSVPEGLGHPLPRYTGAVLRLPVLVGEEQRLHAERQHAART